MKKTIVVFTSVNVNNLVRKNYTFSLRIKSNFDSSLIQEKYNVKYVKFTDLSWKIMREGDIFVFYKAQFFLKSIFNLVNVIKKLGKKVVFDLDDYYFDLPAYSFSKHLNEGSRLMNMIYSIGRADLVTVSTPYLRYQLLKYNKNTIVCENTIVLDDFKEPCEKSDIINILITSGDNLKLNTFKKEFILCLEKIKKEFGDQVVIYFLGKFSNIENISRIADRIIDKTSPSQYFQCLKENDFHIGLVPLGAEEDPETFISHSSKSNIKFLEFAAHGIAGVYSEIEPYKMIDNGCNGLIVRNSVNEWCCAIKKLVTDHELREKIVRNSQRVVREKYSKKISQDKWLELLNNVAATIKEKRKVRYNFMEFLRLEYFIFDYHMNLVHQKILFLRLLVRRHEFREIRIRVGNIFKAVLN